MTRVRWLCAVLVLPICLLAVVSCGRKTDPLIPDSPRPEAVQGLKAAFQDTTVVLSWRIPERNSEGKNLPPGAITEFRVFRGEIGREERRSRLKQVAQISVADPAPAEVRSGTVTWTDTGLSYGKRYGYRVRAYGLRGSASDYSGEVLVAPEPSPVAPHGLTATAGDGFVVLAWEPVTRLTNGEPYAGFIGYNLYRGTGTGGVEPAPLNPVPLAVSTYRDEAVENGRQYSYRVRAVTSPVEPWRESPLSAEVAASPQDRTPPEPPTGVTVVPGIGRVFLTWNENRESDLAGYYVYRSAKSGGEYERLTDKPVTRTTYSDESVRQGMTYYYVLTAVDKSGNESAHSKEHKTYTESLR